MFEPRVILHPTDYSPSSAYAFTIATDLARQHKARILILHVVETLGPENVTYGEAVSQIQPEGYDQRIWVDFRHRFPSTPGLETELLLAQGDPVTEIERVARDRQCDLIVMGTHGRSGLSRLLMGSIAEQVIRLAPCPILVAKAVPPFRPKE